MKRHLFFALTFIIVAFPLLAACQAAPQKPTPTPAPRAIPTPTPAATPSPEEAWRAKVVETAKKEGTLNLYSSIGGDIGKAIHEAFQKKYGVKVEPVSGRGSEIRAKVQAEDRGKAYVADVVQVGTSNILLSDLGLLDRPTTPLLEAPVDWAFHPMTTWDPVNKTALGYSYTIVVWLVNSNLVKPGEEPKTFQDLLDPKWKKKLLIDNVGTSGLGNLMYVGVRDVLGIDYWKKFAAQEPIIIAGGGYDAQVREVAQGSYPILVGTATTLFADNMKKGAPIRIVVPQDVVVGYLNTVSVVKNAPHANAANLYIDWLLSKEGQKVNTEASWDIPIRKDVDPAKVPGLEIKGKLQLTTREQNAKLADSAKEASEVFKLGK